MLMPLNAARILEVPGVTVTAYPDVTSAKAVAKQKQVLAMVHGKIKRQVEDVDDALRWLEEEAVPEGCRERGQAANALAQWGRAREKRDAALAVLDRHAMMACRAEQSVAALPNRKEQTVLKDAIQELADAATKLSTVHGQMQKLEEEMEGVYSAGHSAQPDELSLIHI